VPVRLPLTLVQLLVAWLLLTSLGHRGDPWPVVGAAVLAFLAYLAGRAVPEPARPWVAGLVGAASLAAVLLGDGPLDFVLSGPLGYANANAALAVQGGAALALVGTAGPAWRRVAGILGAVAAVVLALLIGAAAAVVGGVLVLLAVAAPAPTARRVSVLLSVGTLVGASVLPFVVGAVGADDAVRRALTERRVQLWSDGVAALPDHLLLGVGARDFPTVSPTAAHDSDTREAHAELLQRAVENGLPGLLLEAGVVAAVALDLARRAWPATGGAAPAVGLAALAALWANAGVDWVLAFPAVVAAGGVVVGLGAGRLGRRRGSSKRPISPT
jgi:O-antigen ligase